MLKLLLLYCLCLLFPFAGGAQALKDSGFIQHSGNMSERWELGKENDRGVFRVTPYKPVYFTAGRWSNNPNGQPQSENPAYSLPFRVNYNNYEAKFQFSLKTKIAKALFGGRGDLWVAYTQKAHWQIYNEALSRPFRELNYEPELILNFKTNYTLLGFDGRMLALIFNHQSNGRALPLSRSWNRIMIQAGFERKNWQLYLRPWIRLSDDEDENPLIADYIGRAEAIVIWNLHKHQFSLVVTHSLKAENGGRGSLLFTWVFPVISNLRCQLQLGEGYGETLVDYNHRQATIGLGLCLVQW